ncbi:MAG TPA: chemotaxis protein CheA [Pyrinomonadaceae bacterium]|nr:chemotaxis protein CheA [Pyrinomonadaceae bacterium]
MSQIERQTILAINQTRNQLSSLQHDDKETIIHSGSALESVIVEIPESHSEVTEALTLCLNALQAIFLEQFDDFELMVKAVLGALIASEQALGAHPNPILELMLKQAKTGLQNELQKIKADEEEIIDQVEHRVSISSLDEVAASLINLDLSDKKGLENVCETLKVISVEEKNTEKRKLIVKAARELTKIINGKSENVSDTFNLVSELIDKANNCERDELTILFPAELETSPAQVKKEEPIETKPAKTINSQNSGKIESLPIEMELIEEFEPDILPVDSDLSLVSEFVVESYEMLEAAESALLTLETEPENNESVNTIFRAFHTVKGSSAYLGLKRLTELAHHAESLLSRIRDREIQCSGGYANLALRSLDTLKSMLKAVEGCSVGTILQLPVGFTELITILKNPESFGVTGESDFQITKQKPFDNHQDSTEPISIQEIIEEVLTTGNNENTSLSQNIALFTGSDNENSFTKKAQTPDSSVRVRTDRLDRLIDMVGELVIAQSMLAQDTTVVQGLHHELTRKISHAGKIVRELQDLSMGMRMIPLKNSFQKMARLVRDVSKKCGKKVEFITDGEETEIDRNMVDLIADPLIHMVRNAVDHGIETPDIRQSINKSPTGKVKLEAYHAGGDVVVELSDDGAGLDPEKLVAKAISKNLIESGKGMSESEIFHLIFAPGFSTAESVTDVSGRGVGMDVVRRNIEAIRGRIEISSEKGKGSVFTIRIPLTLAITDGMLVRVGSEKYIVPTVNIHLSFQPNQKMLSSVTGRGELVSLRGELMPVFRLHQLFDVEGAIEDPTEGLLMIVADGRRRCALLVDELLGQQQVVTKTLGQGVGKIPGVSGGAILGDGCVGLILDTTEIVGLARQTLSMSNQKEMEEPHKIAA